MTVYFDSSAIVKLLLKEVGWEIVEDVWRRAANRLINRLAYPEVRAALASTARGHRITEEELGALVDDLEAAHRACHVVDVDNLISVEAGDLADQYALRGYDGVHLASALSIDSPRVLLATWDRELADAARACGCSVVPAAG